MKTSPTIQKPKFLATIPPTQSFDPEDVGPRLKADDSTGYEFPLNVSDIEGVDEQGTSKPIHGQFVYYPVVVQDSSQV